MRRPPAQRRRPPHHHPPPPWPPPAPPPRPPAWPAGAERGSGDGCGVVVEQLAAGSGKRTARPRLAHARRAAAPTSCRRRAHLFLSLLLLLLHQLLPPLEFAAEAAVRGHHHQSDAAPPRQLPAPPPRLTSCSASRPSRPPGPRSTWAAAPSRHHSPPSCCWLVAAARSRCSVMPGQVGGADTTSIAQHTGRDGARSAPAFLPPPAPPARLSHAASGRVHLACNAARMPSPPSRSCACPPPLGATWRCGGVFASWRAVRGGRCSPCDARGSGYNAPRHRRATLRHPAAPQALVPLPPSVGSQLHTRRQLSHGELSRRACGGAFGARARSPVSGTVCGPSARIR